MENTETVYIDLQQHLDKQAVGFPTTKSGVELRILKHYFTPEQAGLALHLSYRPQSVPEIYDKAKSTGVSYESVKSMLEEMVSHGAIGTMEKGGDDYFYTMPLLVGMIEWTSNLTPQLLTDFGEYVTGEYGRVYAGTKVSQMRTIPVQQSIQVEHHVTTYDHIREIINNTDGPIAINPCMCREGAKSQGNSCKITERVETCMCFGDWAKHFIKTGGSREVTREEALEIMHKNEEDGLVLQPTNYQKIDFVCACCGCCCGVLQIQKALPNPAIQWAHNYFAAIETETCTGCGTCVERCQVNAVILDEKNDYAAINMERCIGCGNCIVSCPSESLYLLKRESEVAPPKDRTDLYRMLAER